MVAPWDRRSTGEQDRIRGLLLERWLPAALDFSPYWQRRAEGLGLETRTLTGREDLQRFPLVRERELVEQAGPGGTALVMRPTESQVRARASSGMLLRIAGAIRREGAEGARATLLDEYKPIWVHEAGALVVAASRSDLDRMHRAGARAAAVLGLTDADYLVSAVPPGPSLEHWGVFHLGLGSSLLSLQPRAAGDDLDAAVAAFRLVPATAVAVLPEDAIALADAARDARAEVARVDTVVLVGPPPDEATRGAIADAWQAAGAVETVRVRALYAPPGSRAVWAEPIESPTGLVTYPDLEVIEVVDPLTGEATDGDGDLVYTSAGWHGTALVRFQTGVYVSGIDRDVDPASARTTPRLVGEVVPAAWQPDLRRADGSTVRIDYRDAAAALANSPGVRAWRIELRSPTARKRHDRLIVEVGGSLEDEAKATLERRLEAAVGVRPDAIKVDEDPRAVDLKAQELGSVFADLR